LYNCEVEKLKTVLRLRYHYTAIKPEYSLTLLFFTAVICFNLVTSLALAYLK